MFNRLTIEISKLKEFEQLDLLRKMVEGVLSIEALLMTLGHTNELRLHGDTINTINNMISSLSDSFQAKESEKPGYAILNEYHQLAIQQRISNSDEYQTRLLRYFNRDSHALNTFDKIKLQDNTVIHAMNLCIGLLAHTVYNDQSLATADQLKLFIILKSDPLAKCTMKSPVISAALMRFQLFYNILCNSYIPDDKRKFIEMITLRLLDLEFSYRTPLNKTIRLLNRMKKELDRGYVNKLASKFLVFGSETPKSAIALRNILAKLPEECNVMRSDDIQKDVATIKDIFAQAFAIIKEEKSKIHLWSKDEGEFWKGLFDDMNAVIKEEGDALGMNSQVRLKPGK